MEKISLISSTCYNTFTIHSRHLRFEEMQAILPVEIGNHWEQYFNFDQIFRRLNRNDFTSNEAKLEFLFNQKLLVKINARYVPTHLALITSALDFSTLPNFEKFQIRLIVYRGHNKFDIKFDKIYNEGYTLSLDKIIREILNQLPIFEVYKLATRITLPIIPELAIRELLVNAIIHRDYGVNNSRLLIELFEDRIEITNPGSLVSDLAIDRLIDHPSKTRNEVLADLMRNLGFAEERGSGIDKAVAVCEENALPAIKFINGPDYFKAIIYSQRMYSELESNERIDAIYQHACLNFVLSKKTTNTTIRQRFKFTEKESTKVTRIITESIKSKKIKLANPNSSRKEYHYLPYWA